MFEGNRSENIENCLELVLNSFMTLCTTEMAVYSTKNMFRDLPDRSVSAGFHAFVSCAQFIKQLNYV